MHIDETGERVHAIRIDHALSGFEFARWCTTRIKRRDTVVFDHDVDRAGGRGAAAFDNGRPADYQLAEGAFAFARRAIGHPFHLRCQWLRGEGGECRQCDLQGFHRFPLRSAAGFHPDDTGVCGNPCVQQAVKLQSR